MRVAVAGPPPTNITQVSGINLTGRDWSQDFAKLQNLNASLTDIFGQIVLGSVFNAAVNGGTNIFASDLSPTRSPVIFRVYACFNASGVLSVVRTKQGNSVIEQLNGGVTLNANAAYIFDVIVESGETINLRYSVSCTCLTLKVIETRM